MFFGKIAHRSILSALLVSALTLTACTPASPGTSPDTGQPATSPVTTALQTQAVTQPAAPADSTVVLTDVTGREVVLEKPAAKVVGTHNPTMNAAVVLGGGGRFIAGFGNKEMSRGLYESVIENYDDLLQIGKGSTINYETVIASGADLAILPERYQDLVAQFEEIDMKALVALPNEESFESVTGSLTLLGKALGVPERAQAINDFFSDRIDHANSITADLDVRQKVIFLGASSQLSVAPSAMIQTQLIEVAGGINAVTGVEGEGGFIDVNIEQIIDWDPEVIWYPAYADYDAQTLLDDPAWQAITAVKNGQVYAFPSVLEPWDQPTASLALGIAWATHNLHPEVYSREQIIKDADDFYTLVYGKTFSVQEMGLE